MSGRVFISDDVLLSAELLRCDLIKRAKLENKKVVWRV